MTKNPKKVCILGSGKGWEHCPQDTDQEIWGVNGMIFKNKKLDKVFMMDVLDEMPTITSGGRTLEEAIETINKLDIPLIAPYKYEEIPKSEAFPIHEVVQEFGQPYFNNTIGYMIAYAILHGVEQLDTWGINQSSSSEYFYEKGCVEYWVGMAAGRGMMVQLNGNYCELLRSSARNKKDTMYGYNKTYEELFDNKEAFGIPGAYKLLRKVGKMESRKVNQFEKPNTSFSNDGGEKL